MFACFTLGGGQWGGTRRWRPLGSQVLKLLANASPVTGHLITSGALTSLEKQLVRGRLRTNRAKEVT